MDNTKFSNIDLVEMSGCCCFDTVSTSEVGIVESCGKFSRLAEVIDSTSSFLLQNIPIYKYLYPPKIQAGCFCISCPFEYVAGRVSLRVQELKVRLETKTLDNVFVTVDVSVQYQVIDFYLRIFKVNK